MVENGCILQDITGRHAFTATGQLITHAISLDGQTWLPLPPAVAAGPELYDAGGITAAAVICAAGGYWLFYTASDAAGRQRVLLANSTDLTRWDKYPQNPIVHALPTHLRPVQINRINLTFLENEWDLTLSNIKQEAVNISYRSPDLLRWRLL